MNLGHSAEISLESFAYPYPGRSAKSNSGFERPARRTAKKLMARVRPGVELVLANFSPSRELIRLDLPTFERPRNATSGGPGFGKCDASNADSMNWAATRTIYLVSSLRKGMASQRRLLQA